MTLLLDTCILVDLLRGKPKALQWLAKEGATPLAISAVTAFELSKGIENPADEAQVQRALDEVILIALDGPIARRAGVIHRRFGPSHGMDVGDAMIAATAQTLRLPLVTLNSKHFPMLDRVVRPY